MSNIIPFRTRGEWEKEKKEKIKREWQEFVEFEKKHSNYLHEYEENK